MITSIFSKSKPINFILVGLLITVVFTVNNFKYITGSFQAIAAAVMKLLLLVFLVFLLDFIVSKNKLTQGNSYAIMTFGLLFLMFPQASTYSDLLLSNLFVLFAIRRLISLHSNLHLKKKFFDAGFWIAIATFYYFWAFLFFALVIVALIYHSQNNLKNVIVPFIGVATFMVLLLTYNILVYDMYIRPSDFERYASLDFTPYNSLTSILILTLIFSSYLWMLIYYFNALKDKNKKIRPSYFLVAWASFLAVFVAIIAPVKNGSEFIFLFAPFSIIAANYLEVVSERWFKEVFPFLFVLIPVLSLFL